MSLFFAAILAASSAPTATQQAPAMAPAPQAQQHGQHAQSGTKPQGEGCCCKSMAAGGKKMSCCAEQGADHGGEHAKHGETR